MHSFLTTPFVSVFLATGAISGVGALSIQGYHLIEGTVASASSGIPGSSGNDGSNGSDGATGATGAQGPRGAQGPMGPMGPTGAQGLMGPAGPQGEQGIQGIQGIAGASGADGATGATGATGAQGVAGPAGATGPIGPTGVIAATSPLIYDSNTQTLSLDLDAFQRIGSLDYLQFNPNSTAPNAPGRLVWNSEAGTLNLQGLGGGVTLQLGQESVQRVKNTGATTLLDGHVVRVTGAAGSTMTVEYADNNTAAGATSVIGVLTESIPAGGTGYVTTYGLIHALDTSAFTPGAPIYLNGAGQLTAVRPINGRIVKLGYAVSISATDGIVYINPLQNFEPNIGGACQVPGQAGTGIYAWYNLAGARWIVVCDY